MISWILSSSVLIVLVLILRLVFRGRLSLRLQYALWLPVLIRLLLPFPIWSSSISVLNTLPKEEPPAQVQVAELPKFVIPPLGNGISQSIYEIGDSDPFFQLFEDTEEGAFDWNQVLSLLYGIGVLLVGGFFLTLYLWFFLRLRRFRRILPYETRSVFIYRVKTIDAPCLFGLLKPAIYITDEVAEDPVVLEHCMAHEMTHYRHGDHIWAILRSLCIALHWYNPLVWVAAILSGRDAELACDEAAILRLGEEERKAYGQTLLSMSCKKNRALSIAATTMTGGKRTLKERILRIVRKPKMAVYTPFVLLLICAIAVGCTFSDAKAETVAESEQEEILATVNWHEVEDGYLYHIPDVSFPLNQPFGVAGSFIKHPPFQESYRGRVNRNSVYPDEGLQELSGELAEIYDVSTVSGAMEYSYRLLPYLREMPVLKKAGYFSDGEVYLETLYPHGGGVCLAHYRQYTKPDDYWMLSPEERLHNRPTVYDGGFYVTFSMVDGHVICLQNSLNGEIRPSEAYGTIEDSELSVPEFLSVDLEYEDLTFKDQALWGSGAGYRTVPQDSSVRWENEELQTAATQAVSRLILYRAEDMQEYGQTIGELLTQKDPRFKVVNLSLDKMIRYTDGVWELWYGTEELGIRTSVFVSEADGHIIHIIDGNPYL